MRRSIFVIAILVISVFSNKCDKLSKNYQKDQFWLSVPSNCHLFIVCAPNGDDTHRQIDQSCGDLFWDQHFLTCVKKIPEFAICDRSAKPPTTVATTPYPFKCNFVVNPNNNAEFKPKDTVNNKFTVYQSCAKYFYFSLEKCTCLKNVNAPANTCDNKSFLNFNFDGNFDDSSCTKAQASVVNGFVGFEDHLQGSAAVFNGSGYIDIAAMRGIFAGNYMKEFSISMFFRTDNIRRNELIFDNGDISHNVTILMGFVGRSNMLSALIKVSGGLLKNKKVSIGLRLNQSANTWQHVAYVYKNGDLTLTLNGDNRKTSRVNEGSNKEKVDYTIDNIQEPLSLGGRSSGDYLFSGMIDEFRVFKRALSASEVKLLANHSF